SRLRMHGFIIGGAVGLNGGSVIIEDNNGQPLTVSGSPFTFPTKVANCSTYNVTVHAQPAGQVCRVGNASGPIHGANITNVAIACEPAPYTVSATVYGLSSGKSLVLLQDNSSQLLVSANGFFVLPIRASSGDNYSVTVLTQPAGQSCALGKNGS